MRKELALFATIAAAFAFMTFSAQAMPAATLKAASNATAPVIQVRDGCGRHRFRGPHGHCHWEHGWDRH